MDTSCGAPANGRASLIITGSIALVFSILSFILAIVVQLYVDSPKIGFFYLSVFLVVASIFGVASMNRGLVITTLVISIIAIIVGIVAAIIDGIFSGVLNQTEACYSSNGQFYGTSSYYPYAFQCAFDFPGYDCTCVENDQNTCVLFNGPTNCDLILNNYRHLLGADVAFTVFAVISVFALSIVSCVSLCCPQSFPQSQQVSTLQQPMAPTVVVVGSAPSAPQNPQYAVSGAVVANPVSAKY